jgi:uroporphyrinogen decarboxylase
LESNPIGIQKNMNLTHRERMKACLAEDSSLDRPPVALWRHFPVDDQDPALLAAATLDFQKHYDFDLVKVTPASSFSIKDWGAEDTWEGHTEGTRRYIKYVIQKPTDWEHLKVLSPSATHLARQLKCLKLIHAGLSPDVPLLQTIFSPLAQAKNLAGGERLIIHLRTHPEAVLKGLETIAVTTRRFVEACMEVGLDGVFYAVQHAQAGLLVQEEYEKFGLPLDLQILEPVRELWCNLLHMHGDNIYFNLAGKYHCQIVNWHDRETGPSLSEGLKNFKGAVCGGISQNTIVLGDRSEVRKEAADAISQTRGRRLLLGTGCVVPIIAPHGNLVAARQIVEGSE